MKISVYDVCHKKWPQFNNPVEIFTTNQSKDVFSLLETVEQKAKEKNLDLEDLIY